MSDLINTLASGKVVPSKTCECGGCGNMWFVPAMSDEFLPRFCCYCGVEFTSKRTIDGEWPGISREARGQLRELKEAVAIRHWRNDVKTLDAAIDRIEAGDSWASFGEAVFDAFWCDGEPGDMEGGELQEIAVECGLLGRTSEVDAGATHAEGCDWQPGMPLGDCDCWAPTRMAWCALVREQDGTE